MNIKDYGLKENILRKVDKNKTIARIIATHKDRYEIACNNGNGFAKIKRGCYYDNPNSVYPTTGDFVLIEWNESGDSMIYETLKRESSFSRTAASSDRKGELQKERFEQYLKLQKESQYNTDSEQYLKSKKEKFKEISKINKHNTK